MNDPRNDGADCRQLFQEMGLVLNGDMTEVYVGQDSMMIVTPAVNAYGQRGVMGIVGDMSDGTTRIAVRSV